MNSQELTQQKTLEEEDYEALEKCSLSDQVWGFCEAINEKSAENFSDEKICRRVPLSGSFVSCLTLC
jgi:hypothetical protein